MRCCIKQCAIKSVVYITEFTIKSDRTKFYITKLAVKFNITEFYITGCILNLDVMEFHNIESKIKLYLTVLLIIDWAINNDVKKHHIANET